MKRRSSALAALVLAVPLALSSCSLAGSSDDASSDGVDKQRGDVQTLNARAKAYWRALAEGDSQEAFDFLTKRCKDTRIEHTKTMVTSYEQRQINKMAFLEKTTDELIASMETSIESINNGNNRAKVSFNSSFEDISMPNLKFERSDSDNDWYLDSCLPPFSSPEEDKASWRLELDRDEMAYKRGMIEDDGNYNGGVVPGAEPDGVDTNDYQ